MSEYLVALENCTRQARKRASDRMVLLLMSGIMLTLLILGSFFVIVVIGLLWLIPKRQVSAQGLQPKDRLTLENASRAVLAQSIATIAQSIGGVGLLIGLYFTAQSLYTTQQIATSNLEQAKETLKLTHEERLTERFTRAIDQLGNQEIHVRVGAIYALERIARESRDDYKAIIELLAAYIRDRSPRKQESESLRGADDDNDPAEKRRHHPQIYRLPSPLLDGAVSVSIAERMRDWI